MTFETIYNTANTRAAALGLPLVFGDTAVQNVAANSLSVDFFTLDITTGFYNDVNVPRSNGYTIVIRCMGVSEYMRDDAVEIETLIRTDQLLQDMLAPPSRFNAIVLILHLRQANSANLVAAHKGCQHILDRKSTRLNSSH